MPVLNGMPYLPVAVTSLLEQSYAQFELIVSDNCSTDGTMEYLQRLCESEPRLTYFRQQRSLSAWENFKWLLIRCETPFFMWAASDDMWSPNWIQSGMQALEAEGCIGYFGTLCQIAENGDRVKSHAADERTFSFASRTSADARLSKFLWEWEARGKANLIYSVFRTSHLVQAIEASDKRGVDFDCAVVFEALRAGPILTNMESTFYKRITKTSDQLGTARDVKVIWSKSKKTVSENLASLMEFRRRVQQYRLSHLGVLGLMLHATRSLKTFQFIWHKTLERIG